jgi:hypothetical protein
LIQISFGLATVLTETSLFVDDETIYDLHTDTFRRLLASTVNMVRIYREQSKKKTGNSLVMSFTIFDICTLPVFYYTATRCRVPALRRQALAGLSLLRHRECHWDGWLTYAVAKKVVELEEGSAYDGSSLDMEPDVLVPASSRLRNLHIVTAGDPFTTLSLNFEREDVEKALCPHKVVLDIRSGVWSDIGWP